jgi:hypothetical protein
MNVIRWPERSQSRSVLVQSLRYRSADDNLRVELAERNFSKMGGPRHPASGPRPNRINGRERRPSSRQDEHTARRRRQGNESSCLASTDHSKGIYLHICRDDEVGSVARDAQVKSRERTAGDTTRSKCRVLGWSLLAANTYAFAVSDLCHLTWLLTASERKP